MLKRFAQTLLLALPFVVALAAEASDSVRTIDVTLSRYSFSPDRIEVRLGERVRLNVASLDGTHGFQVKALGLSALIPDDGWAVTIELTPKDAGTFEIKCSEYCGKGHGRMRARLIVTPAALAAQSTSDSSRSEPASRSHVAAPPDDDVTLVLAEPDFCVLNLPSTFRLQGVDNFQGQYSPNHRWGDPDTRDAMAFFNASVPLNNQQTRFLYGFGGYSRRLANSAGFYRRALDARNWPQIYPFGFLPVIEPTVVDTSGTVCVRAVLNKWSYDLSGDYGHNSFAFKIGDTLNVSLGPTLPPNKTQFDAGALELNQFVGNVDVSRPFPVRGFVGPLNLAAGAEYRRENYQIHAGEPDSYRDGGVSNQAGGRAAIGAQVFPGFRPSNEVDASRNSVAAYMDVERDVTAWLRLGGAARTEHYSDFGGTIDGKLTVRVQPDLNLGQGLVPVESLTLPVDSAPAKVLGAAPLKPESSLNTGAGVIITPISSLDIALDYYRIAIDDRIVLSGNFTAPPIAALLAPFGANSARFFSNAIDTRTRVVGSVATPPQLIGFESVLFDRIEQRRIECGQPDDSVRLGGQWSRKNIGTNVSLARYGAFCSFTLNPADDQEYSAKWLTDVEASYQVEKYRLAVAAQNLFDVFPDRNGTVNSFNGIQTFPSQSPFGMNGRAIYARIGRRF